MAEGVPLDPDSPIQQVVDALEARLDDFYKNQKAFIAEMRRSIHELTQNQAVIPRQECFITRGSGTLTKFYIFTDGSCITVDGVRKFGIGVFLGDANTSNLSRRASEGCVSMLACELEAASEAMKIASTLNIKHLIIVLDNLPARDILTALIEGRAPQTLLLADLLSSDTFVQSKVKEVVFHLKLFDSIEAHWIRSHQDGRITFKTRGNDKADQLAKLGAARAGVENDPRERDDQEEDSEDDEDVDHQEELRISVDALLQEVAENVLN